MGTQYGDPYLKWVAKHEKPTSNGQPKWRLILGGIRPAIHKWGSVLRDRFVRCRIPCTATPPPHCNPLPAPHHLSAVAHMPPRPELWLHDFGTQFLNLCWRQRFLCVWAQHDYQFMCLGLRNRSPPLELVA